MHRRVRRLALATPLALAAMLATALPAPANHGHLTGDPAMLSLGPDAPGGSSILPIISVGERVNGVRFEGIPDGLGAMPGPHGSVDLFVNHEQSTVPFQNRRDYQDASITLWRLYPDGSVHSGEVAVDHRLGFLRFCSSTMAGPAEGLSQYIYFTGEEDNAIVDVPFGAPYGPDPSVAPDRQGGLAVALDPMTHHLEVLDSAGRHNHENVMVVPGGWDRIALLSGDDTFSAPSSQLYLSLADDEGDLWADRTRLYAFQVTEVDGVPVDPYDPFNGANDYGDIEEGEVFAGRFIRVPGWIARGNTQQKTPQQALEDWSNRHNVFQFIRIEDTAYDRHNPRIVYLADTGERRAIEDATTGRLRRGSSSTFGPYPNGRIFEMEFDPTNPTIVTRFEILLDADAGGYSNPDVMHQPDNMDTSMNSLMVQEDSSQAPESRVWRYDFATETWSVVAQVNDQDWESSGIIDASAFFGPGAWLLDVQAHDQFVKSTVLPSGVTVKREDGQLVLLTLPGT